jgi:hypothetical protein
MATGTQEGGLGNDSHFVVPPTTCFSRRQSTDGADSHLHHQGLVISHQGNHFRPTGLYAGLNVILPLFTHIQWCRIFFFFFFCYSSEPPKPISHLPGPCTRGRKQEAKEGKKTLLSTSPIRLHAQTDTSWARTPSAEAGLPAHRM